ncbi:MAG: pyridoxamine 5'-phosphate oxidase family protein [Alphaproteobacteria bacterium]|nr:pyridoxamine 5'-phosphate oxidase family protein [Alphaproteobacteria bacterium]
MAVRAQIPEMLMPALQGMLPANITTCSLAGEPNTTELSQVYYVDDHHVALSFQFFNKTIRNVRENPYVSVLLIHPENWDNWRLDLRYIRSETSAPLFDDMDMKLEVIASMTGMKGIFKLRAADVYEVLAIELLNDQRR